jgi:rare lipoprotein A
VIVLLIAPVLPRTASATTTIGPPQSAPRYSPLPSVPSTISAQLDEATKHALRLQDSIDRAEEDAVSLRQRIEVVNIRVLRQENVLDEARTTLDSSRARFEERLVTMYKTGFASPIGLLLSANSLADFYARAVILSRIVAEDVRVFREAESSHAEAEQQAAELDGLKLQLVGLRSLHDRRLEELKLNLGQQRLLVATLSAASKAVVTERQAASARSRKEWRDSSIPIDTPVGFVPATVDSDVEAFLVSEYQPRRYARTGEAFSAVCSWYGNEFNGRPTASGQIFNQDDLTCASRTLAFGTRIALERAGRRVIVVVTDRGPFIAGRDLDLSRAAARALGFSGVERCSAVFVDPVSDTKNP